MQPDIIRAAKHSHRESEKQAEVLGQTEGNRHGVQRAVSVVNEDVMAEFLFVDEITQVESWERKTVGGR